MLLTPRKVSELSRNGAIQLIVEGPGDFGAVPVLLRHYLHSLEDFRPNLLGSPIASNGISNLLKPGGIEAYVRIAAAREGAQCVIVVADADKSCIKDRAEELKSRSGSHLPVIVALADENFEDWIYASAETTLAPEAAFQPNKGGLSQIKEFQKYTKSVDQAKLAAKIDFQLARPRSRSLDRLLIKVDGLLAGLDLP